MVGASSQLGLEDRPEADAVVRPVAEIRISLFRKLLIIKTEVLEKGWLTTEVRASLRGRPSGVGCGGWPSRN